MVRYFRATRFSETSVTTHPTSSTRCQKTGAFSHCRRFPFACVYIPSAVACISATWHAKWRNCTPILYILSPSATVHNARSIPTSDVHTWPDDACGTVAIGFPNWGARLAKATRGFPNCGASLVTQQPGDFLIVEQALWHSNQGISLLYSEPSGTRARGFPNCKSQ
jgi:hypothetical protein